MRHGRSEARPADVPDGARCLGGRREEESFEKLGAAFTGLTFVGNIIDLDVLRRAGIEGCDAVAAVTNSDNVNVMISQIARDIFSIPRVLTRVYDPDRERIFAQFGLHTICRPH